MTVAVAVAAVASAGPEGKYGSCRETINAVAAAAAAYHHPETSVAAAPVAAASHHRETSLAAATVAAACHRRQTGVAAAAAAAEACHRRETSVAAAAAAAEACPPRETSVDVAAAAAEACHRRETEHGGSMVPPAHPPPAIFLQFHEPCVESTRNGWCFLVSDGSVGGRPKSLFSRHCNVPGSGGE